MIRDYASRGLGRRAVLAGGLALGCAAWLPAARACQIQTATLMLVHPWTRATGPGATSAVVAMRFEEVVETDRLLGGATPVAEAVEIQGVADPARGIEIPAGEITELHERGPHLLLRGLQFPLQMGRQFPLALDFEKAGRVDASLSIDFVFR